MHDLDCGIAIFDVGPPNIFQASENVPNPKNAMLLAIRLPKETRCSLEDSVTKDVENLALFEDVLSEIAILPSSEHFL